MRTSSQCTPCLGLNGKVNIYIFSSFSLCESQLIYLLGLEMLYLKFVEIILIFVVEWEGFQRLQGFNYQEWKDWDKVTLFTRGASRPGRNTSSNHWEYWRDLMIIIVTDSLSPHGDDQIGLGGATAGPGLVITFSFRHIAVSQESQG